MKKVSLAGFLSEFSGGVKKYFIAAIIVSIFNILFNFMTPQIISFTVDSIIGTKAIALPGFLLSFIDWLGGREALRGNLLFCALGIVFCAVLAGIFNYYSKLNIAKGTEGFTKNLRDRLFHHIQHLPFSWHNSNQTGDIIQRSTSDVDTIRNFISQRLLEVLRTILLVSIALVLMFLMNVTLALVCFATIPVIVLYSAIFHKRISRQFKKADEAEGDLMVAVQENLTGVRVVRAFGREEFERENFEEKNDGFANKWIDLGYTLGIFWGIGDFATGLQQLTIIAVGTYLAANGSMTLGELLVFISYTATISWPIRNLGHALSEFSKATVSIKRIREILDAEEERYGESELKPPLRGDVSFEHVSFAYDSAEVLHDLSFTVEKGTTVGILGSTGSGKSTITYLLNRLYELEPGSGTIKIGGMDIKDINIKWLRRGVGLVLQEPFLFSKTVRENIGIAASSAELEEMRGAARTAAVDGDIMKFTDGYDTLVGERGVTLSGGQKQRIAIARTLMMECPIMVFDDSMSAVDMETDAEIREALRENTGEATVFLISHRISTLMQADKILVIENGCLADSGSHAELISRDGLYRRVYDMQCSAGEDGGESHG